MASTAFASSTSGGTTVAFRPMSERIFFLAGEVDARYSVVTTTPLSAQTWRWFPCDEYGGRDPTPPQTPCHSRPCRVNRCLDPAPPGHMPHRQSVLARAFRGRKLRRTLRHCEEDRE